MNSWFIKKAAYATIGMILMAVMMVLAPAVPTDTLKMFLGVVMTVIAVCGIVSVVYGFFYLLFEG